MESTDRVTIFKRPVTKYSGLEIVELAYSAYPPSILVRARNIDGNSLCTISKEDVELAMADAKKIRDNLKFERVLLYVNGSMFIDPAISATTTGKEQP